MKKNDLKRSLWKRAWVKYLIMMKAVWIIMCVTMMHVSASNIYSQTMKVNIKMNNVDLEHVLWSIKNQTEFKFFYNSEDVRNVKRININLKNATAAEILTQCLRGTDLTYEIVN
ncbi:MAG: STN domain-containing protein, partial [Bacteroidota bacterium]|nr:STN domain-containing protein [Bacteroidota bacterium]